MRVNTVIFRALAIMISIMRELSLGLKFLLVLL